MLAFASHMVTMCIVSMYILGGIIADICFNAEDLCMYILRFCIVLYILYQRLILKLLKVSYEKTRACNLSHVFTWSASFSLVEAVLHSRISSFDIRYFHRYKTSAFQGVKRCLTLEDHSLQCRYCLQHHQTYIFKNPFLKSFNYW